MSAGGTGLLLGLMVGYGIAWARRNRTTVAGQSAAGPAPATGGGTAPAHPALIGRGEPAGHEQQPTQALPAAGDHAISEAPPGGGPKLANDVTARS